jgi:hypothetical protein
MKSPSFSCDLWSINRLLRWTGWRLIVVVDVVGGFKAPTRIGFAWYGWSWVLVED